MPESPAAIAPPPVKPKLRGVSHEIAAFVFPFFGLALFLAADTTAVRWSVVVYTFGLTAMYTASACYHRGHWSDPVRLRLRRLDHAMIIVAIAATYTGIAVGGLGRHTTQVLLTLAWSLAVVGVVVQVVWVHAPRWLSALVYIALGWMAVAFTPTLWRQLGVVTFVLLALGGVVYSVGAVVYTTKRPDPAPTVFGFHEVFHALVVVAGLLFYAAIARVVVGG